MHPIALYCTVILGLLVFGLGLGVSMARFRYRVSCGSPEAPEHPLTCLVRAHGNTVEFAPFLALLFILIGQQAPTTWQLALMIGATASRVLLVLGLAALRGLKRPNPLRFAGALGTYLCGLGLTLSLLV